MKTIYILIPFLALAVLVGACSQGSQPQPDISLPETIIQKTVYIGPHLVDCVGVAPQKCMQVKENPGDDYKLFYGQIDGFDYEEGYEYKLTVKEQTVDNPPADGSSIQWTLVSVESKTPAAATLEGVLWGLVSYMGADGNLVNVLPDVNVTAEFKDDQVNGSAGCNTYFGPARAAGNKLEVGPLGSTQMFCMDPKGLMDQESAYLAGLQNAATYLAQGGKLEISDANGHVILVYHELQSKPLVGTNWILLSYNNGQQAVVSVLPGSTITAEFAEDRQLTGSAGCNTYSATYRLDGSSIQIGPAATTRMMCAEPAGVMEQEAAYTAALQSAASFTIQLDRLTLSGSNGETIAQYTAAP
jgi:heat shock protein HslJ